MSKRIETIFVLSRILCSTYKLELFDILNSKHWVFATGRKVSTEKTCRIFIISQKFDIRLYLRLILEFDLDHI